MFVIWRYESYLKNETLHCYGSSINIALINKQFVNLITQD